MLLEVIPQIGLSSDLVLPEIVQEFEFLLDHITTRNYENIYQVKLSLRKIGTPSKLIIQNELRELLAVELSPDCYRVLNRLKMCDPIIIAAPESKDFILTRLYGMNCMRSDGSFLLFLIAD